MEKKCLSGFPPFLQRENEQQLLLSFYGGGQRCNNPFFPRNRTMVGQISRRAVNRSIVASAATSAFLLRDNSARELICSLLSVAAAKGFDRFCTCRDVIGFWLLCGHVPRVSAMASKQEITPGRRRRSFESSEMCK